ncbi:hypothetical protein ANN_19647 [Periplaneta americana]|uniref:Uncharacterized protein n=1 Tax=Periplaneta americana TaxID=6978 RepID=A0ABQ8SAG3_PERAM|nr:hypothetical protein ANN_19647 [Periplaneta americana]
MAGLCESGNEPPGSLKASNGFESVWSTALWLKVLVFHSGDSCQIVIEFVMDKDEVFLEVLLFLSINPPTFSTVDSEKIPRKQKLLLESVPLCLDFSKIGPRLTLALAPIDIYCDSHIETRSRVPQESRSRVSRHGLHGALGDGARRGEERGGCDTLFRGREGKVKQLVTEEKDPEKFGWPLSSRRLSTDRELSRN